ncbi:MAG: 2-dehydro-3-deoxygalactonokinase [Hyphomicrobiaceae bacterium]|nr:2-dehydro-3-deoxygalactonokinase [Hyphomicrobiaceae bacterium]
MKDGQFIAVDWGTSSFRAALVDAAGVILGRIESGDGIMSVEGSAFQATLMRLLAGWTGGHQKLPIIMSGMIGSRQGWVEAAYLSTPVDLSALGEALTWVDGAALGAIALVPGVETRDGAGVPDVMRGEETQILGALATSGAADGLFVLPGTHSKWAWVASRRLLRFQTFMTGEVFAALRGHTILGRLMGEAADTFDAHGFRAGVVAGAADGQPGQLLTRIFAARTFGLRDDWTAARLESYLSGLLIGAELAVGRGLAVDVGVITIVANSKLTEVYELAAASLGIGIRRAGDDLAVAGQLALVRQGIFERNGGAL